MQRGSDKIISSDKSSISSYSTNPPYSAINSSSIQSPSLSSTSPSTTTSPIVYSSDISTTYITKPFTMSAPAPAPAPGSSATTPAPAPAPGSSTTTSASAPAPGSSTTTPASAPAPAPGSSTTTPSLNTKFNEVVDQIKTNFVSLMENRLFFYCMTIMITIGFAFFIFFRGYNAEGIIFSIIIDMILIFLTIVIITYYYISSTIQKEDLFKTTMESVEKSFDDPKSIFIAIIAIVLFYILLFIIGVPMSKELKPIMIRILETKIWIVLLFFIINDGMKFLFQLNVADLCIEQIYNLWNQFHSNKIERNHKIPVDDIKVITPVVNIDVDEVYNIANNSFTYQDAQAVCTSLDGRLATYDEIENSYEKGGEWCNYGWSDSQMILFPTQKSTWNELQKSSTNKNNCGRPGVNGGHLEDSSKKFGINCYGKKPNAKVLDKIKNDTNVKAIKSKEDIILDAKIKYWRENGEKMLTVNSFNSKQWNEI